jgi:hypothetical protein
LEVRNRNDDVAVICTKVLEFVCLTRLPPSFLGQTVNGPKRTQNSLNYDVMESTSIGLPILSVLT